MSAAPVQPREASSAQVGIRLGCRRLWEIGFVWRVAAGYVALYLVWLLHFVPQAPEDARWSPWLLAPLGAAGALLALRAGWRSHLHPDARAAWRWIGASLGFAVLASLDDALARLSSVAAPADAIGHAAQAIAYLCLAAGLLRMPVALRGGHDRLKVLLDGAIVVVGGGLAIWRLNFAPAPIDFSLGARLLPHAYPLFDLFVLVGVARLLLRRPIGAPTLAMDLLCAGLVVGAVANTLWIAVGAAHAHGGLPDVLRAVAGLLLVAAAEDAGRGPVYAAPPEASLAPRGGVVLQAGLGVGIGLLVLVAIGLPLTAEHWTSAAVIALAALLVLRQIVSSREGLQLLAETTTRGHESLFRALVQASTEAVAILGPDRTVRYVSPSALTVLGWRAADVQGRGLAELVDPLDARDVHHHVDLAVTAGGVQVADWKFTRPDGGRAHVSARITNMLDDPTVRGLVVHAHDVSERHAHEERLSRQAFNDPLTGLPNRALFLERLDHSLKLGARRFARVAVLFGDLDHFKEVNDVHGHAQGDLLLKAAADRLQRCVRDSDTVARFGGDEFGVLLEDLSSASDAQATASRLVRAFDAPFEIGGNPFRVGMSLGIALEAAGDTIDSLLHDADVAMYAAKRRGGSRWVLYEPSLEDRPAGNAGRATRF